MIAAATSSYDALHSLALVEENSSVICVKCTFSKPTTTGSVIVGLEKVTKINIVRAVFRP